LALVGRSFRVIFCGDVEFVRERHLE
jgi:hypothetical protein